MKDGSIVKCGVGVRGEFLHALVSIVCDGCGTDMCRALQRRYSIEFRNVVDLSCMYETVRPELAVCGGESLGLDDLVYRMFKRSFERDPSVIRQSGLSISIRELQCTPTFALPSLACTHTPVMQLQRIERSRWHAYLQG